MARKYRVLTHVDIEVQDDGLVVAVDLTKLSEKLEFDISNEHSDEEIAADQESIQATLDSNFFNQFIQQTIRRES